MSAVSESPALFSSDVDAVPDSGHESRANGAGITMSVSVVAERVHVAAVAVESRRYEFVPLVQVHAWTAIPKHLPLFESLLVFENYPTIHLDEAPSAALAIGEVRFVERTNYPLTLVVAPGSDPWAARLSSASWI